MADDVCMCGRARGSSVHDAGAINGHAFEPNRTEAERIERERQEQSARDIARRAKQIREACYCEGLHDAELIAAAIIADRVEDLHGRLDGLQAELSDISQAVWRRDR